MLGNGLPLSGRIAIKAAVPTQGCIQVGHPYIITFETVRMELQFNLSIQCSLSPGPPAIGQMTLRIHRINATFTSQLEVVCNIRLCMYRH